VRGGQWAAYSAHRATTRSWKSNTGEAGSTSQERQNHRGQHQDMVDQYQSSKQQARHGIGTICRLQDHRFEAGRRNARQFDNEPTK
ncbi:MAG TPA: hypothetical protein PKH05_07910, partial [Nitrospira sp.]|nr:hypothetical protein [Nitrospira sp.]